MKQSPNSFRPTYFQELIRQWILFIPLATAVAGSAAIYVIPSERYSELLPPMFFVGALVVTAAMVHQRYMLGLNLALTEEVQVAHNRLDTLHQLSVALGTSLSVREVAQIVLDHTLLLIGEKRGALWVLTELASPAELQIPADKPQRALVSKENTATFLAASDERQWKLFALSGLEISREAATLQQWKSQFLPASSEEKFAENHAADKKSADKISADYFDGEVSHKKGLVPILWNGEIGAVIFVESSHHAAEENVLLDDIALIAGPSLQNALIYQTAAEHAEIDGLTGLYNHRAIQERLQQEIARARRAQHANPDASLALVAMDVTDFKLFNDTYGHAVGDEVLRRISEALRSTFRASDVVGRFGGDEFLMLLPDTAFRGSEILSARAVEAVASQPFLAPDGSRVTIRLTCGVSSFPADGHSATDLLRVADERLYKAKRKGELLIQQETKPAATLAPVVRPDWSTIGLFETLVSTIDSKDHYTKNQCERVWRYALMIAHEMEVPAEMMRAVHFCSLVYDVGKIVIPDAILRKPGRLTREEFEIMQQHTVFGTMIVKDLPFLNDVLGGVRHHHEHWDGSGYPDKLCRLEIPLLARIMAVADSFSAMESQRPYRKALLQKQALDEINSRKSARYDPEVVDAFEIVIEKLAAEKISIAEVLQLNQIENLALIEDSKIENIGTVKI